MESSLIKQRGQNMPSTNLPSSSGGLNLRDSLDIMDARDCIQMDNIIPDNGSDKVRPGYVSLSTQASNTLIPYGNSGLLSADGGIVHRIDTVTGVSTELKNTLLSDDWVHTSFTDGAGNIYTFIANGVDVAQRYNGSTLTDVGFTIPVGVKLDSPLSFKNRLYFVDEGTFNIYYGGVQSISGALTKFSVSSFFKRGGSIVALANWTQDAGFGMDDLFAIFSSEGEVLVYTGLSPADSNWSLRGLFQISSPIGKRCVERMGGDLLITTQQGYFPLSEVLSQDRANKVSVSDKINPVVLGKDFTKRWCIHWYSKAGWVIINAPSSTTGYQYEQHVMNIRTGSWCRFVGMDALDWAVVGDQLFFCNQSGIFEANKGTKDNGGYVTYYKQMAYNKFDSDMPKQALRIKPRYNTNNNIDFYKRVNVDFKQGSLTRVQTSVTGNVSLWDEAIWDVSFWSSENQINSFKASIYSTVGTYLSIGIWGQTSEELEFYSMGLLLKAGNGDI